ncbi:MAG: hypothetical protein N2049_03665 [Anaerolineales bacterium]|nr:hypothetical protein [Anaerolineales bacterium]MCX7608301.1 hypothetical protein [Anaerolineales bacterium]MDW8227330.1 hypothetical protein [Anaerolineales bacterium]
MNEHELEKRLFEWMRPVAPREEFVRQVGHRLHALSMPVSYTRMATWQTLLLLLGGFFAFGILLILLAKAFLGLLSKPGKETGTA